MGLEPTLQPHVFCFGWLLAAWTSLGLPRNTFRIPSVGLPCPRRQSLTQNRRWMAALTALGASSKYVSYSFVAPPCHRRQSFTRGAEPPCPRRQALTQKRRWLCGDRWGG